MKASLKSFANADEVRSLPKTKIEVVNFADGTTLMRVNFAPGWKWSDCIKPTVKTSSCQVPHINYVVSGQLTVAMDDGTKIELKPGDTAVIPPGHDAWVTGSEPFVAIDFSAGKIFGKP